MSMAGTQCRNFAKLSQTIWGVCSLSDLLPRPDCRSRLQSVLRSGSSPLHSHPFFPIVLYRGTANLKLYRSGYLPYDRYSLGCFRIKILLRGWDLASAGIFKRSMGARNQVGIIGLSYRPVRLHRMAELIPWNRFLCFIEVKNSGSG